MCSLLVLLIFLTSLVQLLANALQLACLYRAHHQSNMFVNSSSSQRDRRCCSGCSSCCTDDLQEEGQTATYLLLQFKRHLLQLALPLHHYFFGVLEAWQQQIQLLLLGTQLLLALLHPCVGCA
jgi:hypothetical protein